MAESVPPWKVMVPVKWVLTVTIAPVFDWVIFPLYVMFEVIAALVPSTSTELPALGFVITKLVGVPLRPKVKAPPEPLVISIPASPPFKVVVPDVALKL